MQNFPTIVSFYTKNTPYELEAQNLITSCEKWDLAFSVEGIEWKGSWELNCAFKPFFLLQKLQELKRPILWVDADGVFTRRPNIETFLQADMAVRINEDCASDHPSKVISSTIFVNFTEAAFHLLKDWAEECIRQLNDENRKEEFWDQIALRNAIQVKNLAANVVALPLAYAKIYDHSKDCESVKEPIIEHYQASRRYKNKLF